MKPRRRDWRFEVTIVEPEPGRLEVRVRPEDEPERRLESLEELYRYLLERLRFDPGRLLT